MAWLLLNFELWLEYFILIQAGIGFAMFLGDKFVKPYCNDKNKHLGTISQPVMGLFASILFQAAGVPLLQAMSWSTGLFTAANLTPRVLKGTVTWLDTKREESLQNRDVRLVKCLGKMMSIPEDEMECILKDAGLIKSGKDPKGEINAEEVKDAIEALSKRKDDDDCPFKEKTLDPEPETIIEETLQPDSAIPAEG